MNVSVFAKTDYRSIPRFLIVPKNQAKPIRYVLVVNITQATHSKYTNLS